MRVASLIQQDGRSFIEMAANEESTAHHHSDPRVVLVL